MTVEDEKEKKEEPILIILGEEEWSESAETEFAPLREREQHLYFVKGDSNPHNYSISIERGE